jgi:hypothetical protein
MSRSSVGRASRELADAVIGRTLVDIADEGDDSLCILSIPKILSYLCEEAPHFKDAMRKICTDNEGPIYACRLHGRVRMAAVKTATYGAVLIVRVIVRDTCTYEVACISSSTWTE